VPLSELGSFLLTKFEGLIKANPDDDMIKLDICGTKKGHQIAWVTLNEESTVTFHNVGGDTSSCRLDKGLSVGSKCSISNTISSQTLSSMPESSQYSVSAPSSQSDQRTTLVSGSSSMKSQSASSASAGRPDEAETPVLESTSRSSHSSASLAAGHSAHGTPIADRTSAPASVSTKTRVCRRSVE